MKLIDLGSVKIGERHRKDMGDVRPLAESIAAIGLLHPIVVRDDMTLVVGRRRIEAFKALGRDKIPANVATSFGELTAFLQAEADENTCRKAFTPVEAVAMGEAIERAYKPPTAVESGKKGGRPKKGRKSFPTLSETKQDESARTTAVAAAAVGMSRPTYEKAKAVVESGDEAAIEAMEKTGKVNGAHRKLKAKQRHVQEQEAAKSSGDSTLWTVTGKQDMIECEAVITDPPYGILEASWEPAKLKPFTIEWAKRWNQCGADSFAIFWSQRYLWQGREWFDNSLSDYEFQQLLVWHYPNNKSPQSRKGFKQTWEPVFFYRRKGSSREVIVGGTTWGESLNDFDCYVAAVPQTNFNDAEMKQHPAQKPVSVMRWLVNALTVAGEMIADPFCGSGTTGIAAMQLSRRFHGIEIDKAFVKIAKGRIASYGKAI